MSEANITPIAAAIGGSTEARAAGKASGAKRSREPERSRDELDDDAAILELVSAPDDLPIQCLGVNGGLYYYLDGLYQLRALEAPEHGRTHIVSLFARNENYLLERWGRRDRKGERNGGLHTDEVSNVLMRSCAMAGIMDPSRQVRGLGAWPAADGSLVLHLGDQIWMDGDYRNPGRYGEYVYPAYAPSMRPHAKPQTQDAGQELHAMLKTWQWAHPAQSLFALGFVAQGFVVGALDWRTHMIVDGERGSGKSSLQKLLARLYGSWLLSTSNTSGPALYQLMGGRAQPISIDEFEAGDNPQRKMAVVEILREASSGGNIARGGDNHVGRLFSVNFPALLTSIVTISLKPADESRMVRGALLALKDGAVAPDLSSEKMGKLGTRIMRRMLDQWPRFAETYDVYKRSLALYAGLDQRGQDTYGTLMACADLLLADHVPTLESLQTMVGDVAAMLAPARAEALGDQERCVEHLLSSAIDTGGGVKRSVASWIKQTQQINEHGHPDLDLRNTASRSLATAGLRVDELADDMGGVSLFVSNTHPALTRIFDATPWPGAAGASGSWVGVLRRLPGAYPPKLPKKINGHSTRGTYVPLADLVDWVDE